MSNLIKIQILYFYTGTSKKTRYTLIEGGKTVFIDKWQYDKYYLSSSYNPNIKVLIPFRGYTYHDLKAFELLTK